MRCLDVGRVLDCAPWQLGERPTVVVVALGLHLEATFLRHGGIPSKVTNVRSPVAVGYFLATHM
jgi:hypothetical protein